MLIASEQASWASAFMKKLVAEAMLSWFQLKFSWTVTTPGMPQGRYPVAMQYSSRTLPLCYESTHVDCLWLVLHNIAVIVKHVSCVMQDKPKTVDMGTLITQRQRQWLGFCQIRIVTEQFRYMEAHFRGGAACLARVYAGAIIYRRYSVHWWLFAGQTSYCQRWRHCCRTKHRRKT